MMNENTAIPTTPITMSITIGPMIDLSIAGVRFLSPSNTIIISANILIQYEFALFKMFVSRKPTAQKITPNTSAHIAGEITTLPNFSCPASDANHATRPSLQSMNTGVLYLSGTLGRSFLTLESSFTTVIPICLLASFCSSVRTISPLLSLASSLFPNLCSMIAVSG